MVEPQTARILVGVDDSPESREAVAWAAQQARLTGARIELVHGYRVPLAYVGAGVRAEVAAPDLQEHATSLLADLQKDLAQELGEVPVHPVVAAGEGPAEALIDRSPDAALLVLGSRGEGGALRGFHLGSVAFHCVQHAACPVVVVRTPRSPGVWEPRDDA